MSTSDESRLREAVAGDRTALACVLRDHASCIRGAVAGQIPRRWRSVLSEQDVVQQTFADAVRDIGRFSGTNEGSFAAWLVRLAQCNLHDAVRSLQAHKRGGNRKRADQGYSGDSLFALVELLSESGSTPSRNAAANETRSELEQSIEELPEAYRRVVQLYDLAGEPVERVAEALNRSPGAVFMLRARAHRQLRELLGSTSNYFSDSA